MQLSKISVVYSGVDALPLLRHIILHDEKFSTYKLGLLRALCRAAEGSAGLAVKSEQAVSVPLGLIALNWLRLYLPLVKAHLPQSPTNLGGNEGLGFVRSAFCDLMERGMSGFDLRVAGRFSPEAGGVLHAALRDTIDTIIKMPIAHITYAGGERIFPVVKKKPGPAPTPFALNKKYLASFGEMGVPIDVWHAISHFSVWIEPAIVEQWKELMRVYAKRKGEAAVAHEAAMVAGMRWADPEKVYPDVRKIIRRLFEMRQRVCCVWSKRPLKSSVLDIDHCMPWAAWPCNDLWNLLPVHPDVNRKRKRDRLPSKDVLLEARGRIIEWWRTAYCADQPGTFANRFAEEARASLPGAIGTDGSFDLQDVFDAVVAQQQRLLHDQQVPEWDGI